MKKTLTTVLFSIVLLSTGLARADETQAARSAATRTSRRSARAPRAARTTQAASSSSSSALIRAFGSCDAASFEELAAEVGRMAAMEECTSRGAPSAAGRELSRTAPRQSDLGIPEEAFDAGFEVSGL